MNLNLPKNRYSGFDPIFWHIYDVFERGVGALCIWGGIGAGKSIAIVQLIHHLCLTEMALDPDTGDLMPISILVVGDTFETLQTGLWPIHKEVLRCDLRERTPFAKIYKTGGSITVKYLNGSEVVYKPLALHSTNTAAQSKIEGATANLLISDETQKLPDRFLNIAVERTRGMDFYNPLTGRRRPYMKMWVGRPDHNDYYLRRAKELQENGADIEFYYPKTTDNPRYELDGQYMRDLRAAHPAGIFEVVTQLWPGTTMPATSSIFSMFSPTDYPEGNLLPMDDHTVGNTNKKTAAKNKIFIPTDYNHPTYLAMDFNIDQPSILFIQEHTLENKKVSVIVDEYCPDGETLVTDLVDFIINCPYYDSIVEIIVDPAGKARNVSSTNGSITDILKRSVQKGGTGKRVYDKHPEGDKRFVEDGVLRVQARMCNGNNERELLVRKELWLNPKFKRGIKQTIQAYRRDPNTRQILTGTKGSNADHIADALRYYVRRRCWNSLNKVTTPLPIYTTFNQSHIMPRANPGRI